MKSILLASKPSNNNQLLVGTQIRKNESSPTNHQHYLHLVNNNNTSESVSTEQIEKEHFNKLFSNSKKQVIRNRCSVKSDVDKLKRVSTTATSDVCDGKSDSVDQRRLIKLKSSDNGAESEYFENRPLIGDSKSFLVESENQSKAVKLINLRKKNGTTLIFQKKSKQKANEYRELESLKKRRSLQQWPNAGSTNVGDTQNAIRHSWYDPRAIEEEFDDIDVSNETNHPVLFIVIVNFLCLCNRNDSYCHFLMTSKSLILFLSMITCEPIRILFCFN
jgi:hypothetical protein